MLRELNVLGLLYGSVFEAPKTDRLDTEQLKRAFLGWLRGERDHCKIAQPHTTMRQPETARPCPRHGRERPKGICARCPCR